MKFKIFDTPLSNYGILLTIERFSYKEILKCCDRAQPTKRLLSLKPD
jgi:hypothetical protein